MGYSEERLEEMQFNPVALRQYFWHIAMRWKKLAKENRGKARRQAQSYSVVGFAEVAEKGRELFHWAATLDRLSPVVLENLDALVRSTIAPAHCTCDSHPRPDQRRDKGETVMPSPKEIDAATICAEEFMFAPHELPLSADLHTKYRMMAEQMLIVAEHERWKRNVLFGSAAG